MLSGEDLVSQSGAANADFLSGGGTMGELMRSKDWTDTPLGPVHSWPQSLKTSVSTCLNSRFAILIWWGPDLIKLYNDAYSVILAKKHPAALGRPGREVWREIWDIIGPMLHGVMSRGEATWSDDLLLLLEREGYAEECYFTFSYSPIRDESGGVGGIFTPVQETTARVIGERRTGTLKDLASGGIECKTADEACRSACRTLAANPFDLPFACLYLFDHDGHEARLAGVAGIEAGTPFSPQVIPLPSPRFSTLIETSSLQEIPDVSACFPGLPEGAWGIPVQSAVAVPIILPGQERPEGVLLSAVNPRKRLDADYRSFFEMIAGQIASTLAEVYAFAEEARRAEKLATLDRAKTAFFSNVSHEFRTPLTLMLGPLEELLQAPLDSAAIDKLDLVHRNGLRLQRLVNALLDFSRLEASRVEPNFQPTDLAQFTRDLASNFHSAMNKASLQFVVECPSLSHTVQVDRSMWEKIVFNLISNAFKHTLEGQIAVRLRALGQGVELSVEDTGEGIPESELPHIFERFHRVHSARARTHEGTGIGLALVSELVKLHAGSLRAESRLQQGSIFTVSLPFSQAVVRDQRLPSSLDFAPTDLDREAYIDEATRWLPIAKEERSPDPDTSNLARPRVLLADDNADMRNYIARLLRDHYSVTSVSNGQEAVAAACAAPPDLILTDVMMPGLDGFGVIRELRGRQDTRHIPIVLLSARAGEESRIEGVQAGADDYLIKPFTARELLARVHAHLDISRVRRESADQMRIITEHAPVSLIRLSPEGRYLYINRRHAERFGMRPEEMIGLTPRETLGAAGSQIFQTYFDAALRGETVEYEAEFNYPQGGPCWMRVSYVPECDSAGRVQSVIAVILDMTERHATEIALNQNSEHLKLALEVGHLGTWNWDMHTGSSVWSPEHYRILGLEPESGPANYELWAQRVHPEDLPRVEAAFQSAASERQEFESDYRTIWPDGAVRWVHAQGCYFYDQDGAPVRMIGVASDITERKRTEEARSAMLAREQDARRTAELLNLIGRTLASELDLHQLTQKITDIATQLTHAEFGAFSYHGEAGEGERRQLYTLAAAPPAAFAGFPELLDTPLFRATLAGSGPVRSGDIHSDSRFESDPRFEKTPAGDGMAGLRSYLAVPVVSRHGEVLGGLFFASSKPGVFTAQDEEIASGIAAQSGVAIDNARLFENAVRAQRELQTSNEELVTANRELEQFAYVASHDLQEPLRMVNSYTQLLLRRFGPAMNDPDAAEFASYITSGVQHMQLLIHDLLTYSKVIHSDALEPGTEVDLNACLRQVLAMLQETIAEARAAVISEPLPVVNGDPSQFEQVLQNLISNALKYRNAGVPPEVRISAARTGNEWVMAVRDNGIGFDMQYADRIFGLFKRLHKADYPGTGIGLAICKRIVERCRGRMWAVSEPGKGSTFYFALPA